MFNSFISVKVNELPPVWERLAYSACHLKFYCLLKRACPSFTLMFVISLVLIKPVPEVSLLLQFLGPK